MTNTTHINKIPVQVNGKQRGEITADDLFKRAHKEVEKWIKNETIIKQIYVPLKVISICCKVN